VVEVGVVVQKESLDCGVCRCDMSSRFPAVQDPAMSNNIVHCLICLDCY
jgi:hypothetical protein